MHFPAGHKARRVLCFLGRPPEFTGLDRVLKRIFFLVAFFSFAQVFGTTLLAGCSVSLAWDPCLDASVAGYKVYYGTTSHDYTAALDAGNTASATVSGLTEGATYYFAVTAYDASGAESDFSDEIARVASVSQSGSGTNSGSATQPQIQIHRATTGTFTLTTSGPAGHTYEMLASADLKTWTVIATMTLGSGGLLDFTDPNAANFPQRFYRLREAQSVAPAYARAQLQIQTGAGNSRKLTVTGLASHIYDIEATTDFMVWTVIGTVTAGSGGMIDFTDPDAAKFSQRFYRTRENP